MSVAYMRGSLWACHPQGGWLGLPHLGQQENEAEAARPPKACAWDLQGVPRATPCCHMVSPDSGYEAERWDSWGTIWWQSSTTLSHQYHSNSDPCGQQFLPEGLGGAERRGTGMSSLGLWGVIWYKPSSSSKRCALTTTLPNIRLYGLSS